MWTSVIATAVFSLAGIARAVSVDAAGCAAGPWVNPVKTGLEWGNVDDSHYFCEAGHVDGDILTGVRVWRGDWAVWGLQFKWGDGDFGKTYGTDTDSSDKYREPDQELQWQATDEVVMKLWNNNGKNGLDGVGWIQVWINGEKKLTQGSDHTGDEVVAETGSKRIVAVSGKAASQVNVKNLVEVLQFHYLESKIVSATMTSITYADEMDKYNSEHKGIDPSASLGSLWYRNDNPEGGLNQTFGLSDSIAYTTTKTLVSQTQHSIGFSFSIKQGVEVGIPGLGKGTMDITREVSYENQKMSSETNTETKTETIAITMGSTTQGIPPQSATLCTAHATSGTFESDYTAEVTAKLANGKTFVFKENGHAKSVTFVDATVSCQTMKLSDIPSGVNARKGIDTNTKRHVQNKRAVQFRG